MRTGVYTTRKPRSSGTEPSYAMSKNLSTIPFHTGTLCVLKLLTQRPLSPVFLWSSSRIHIRTVVSACAKILSSTHYYLESSQPLDTLCETLSLFPAHLDRSGIGRFVFSVCINPRSSSHYGRTFSVSRWTPSARLGNLGRIYRYSRRTLAMSSFQTAQTLTDY